jgi:uncharacterized alkaline shock family protein YloU
MHVFNRIIAIFLCLIAIAFSIMVFLLVGGVIRPAQVSPGGFLSGIWSFYSQLSPSNATIATIAFALLMIVALIILVLEIYTLRSGSDHFLVREHSLGKVTVTRNSVRKLVGYEAKSIPGVIETRQTVDQGRNGLSVHVRALLLPEVNAPEVGKILQEKVQKAIQGHMGIDVTEVHVATQLEPFGKPRRRRLQ